MHLYTSMAAKARTLCSARTGRVARALIWWTVCVPFLLAQGFTGSHSLFASNGSADKVTAKKSLQAVAKILFEADVHLAAGNEGRARELYTKAVASGPFSTSYMYAYLAAEEQSEQLFWKIEAAKKGDMPALLQALDQLYLGRADFYTEPQIALDLYQTAKKANPKGTFEQEEDVASLLKMAVAAGPFDTAAFFKKHSLARQKFEDGEGAIPTMRKNKEPYALWEMAESASVDGSHGQADSRLVLQLVARGPATLSERLSAVNAAYKTWMSGRQSGFKLLDHIGPEKAAEYAERRLPSQHRQMDFDVEAAIEEEDRRLAHLEEFFKDPRSFEIQLGFVSSADGKLRGRTWSSALRGTSTNNYSIGQFQAPNGTVGIADFEQGTHRIETVITNTKQRVYLSFSSSVVSRHSHKSTVNASSVTNAGNKSVPFFKTKKEFLHEITLWQSPEEPAEIKFSKANGGTLLIPLISDKHEFSGKFLRYVFDGTCFNYSGVQ